MSNKIRTWVQFIFRTLPIVISVQKEDILIFQGNENISNSDLLYIANKLREWFPDNKVHLLKGIKLENVIRITNE